MQVIIRINDGLFEKVNDKSSLEIIASDETHIDTVKLSHVYRASELPSVEDLLSRKFTVNLKERVGNHIAIAYSQPPFEKTSQPRLKVIRSENNYGYCGIQVECSLAKFVNRNGLGEQTNDDIECALDAIEDYIRRRTGVEFNSRTANVNRLDVNADYMVGEKRIGLYLETLSRPDSRLIPSTFGNTTNYYYNQSRTFAIYSKKAEMERQFKQGKVSKEDVMAAEGLLRIEGRLKTRQAVKRFADQLAIPATGGDLLTKTVASHSISKTLTQLKLDKTNISIKVRERLLVHYFGTEAAKMLGLLKYRELLGEDFWKVLGWSSSTYYRLKKRLETVNLWDATPTISLPILMSVSPYNNSTSLS